MFGRVVEFNKFGRAPPFNRFGRAPPLAAPLNKFVMAAPLNKLEMALSVPLTTLEIGVSKLCVFKFGIRGGCIFGNCIFGNAGTFRACDHTFNNTTVMFVL